MIAIIYYYEQTLPEHMLAPHAYVAGCSASNIQQADNVG